MKASIIIPCRNEEKFIGKCLDSIIQQDYPKEKMEILVIDGMSEDKTREIIKDRIKIYPFLRLLENPNKYTPFGLNIGIKTAKGEIIVRADAHSQYDQDYISKCINYLLKYEEKKVGNIGGMVVLPSMKGFQEIKDDFEKNNPGKKYNINLARAIAISLSHPFGSASSFRVGTKKIRFVDTVFGGCYKREVLEKIKKEDMYFNENLIRSQDLEFNLRLKKAGWRILLIPEIKFSYYPKDSFREFFKHNIQDGIWAIYPLKFTKTLFRIRHYIPLIFVSGFLGLFILSLFFKIFLLLFFLLFSLYLAANLLASAFVARKEKNLQYIIFMPIAFTFRHFGYGLGSIYGLLKLI